MLYLPLYSSKSCPKNFILSLLGICTVFCFSNNNVVVNAAINVLDDNQHSQHFSSRPETNIGKQFVRGYQYMARLQYLEGNLPLCSYGLPYKKIKWNVTVPDDGLPVALLAKNAGCSIEEKIKFVSEYIYPPGVVKYLILDGDQSLTVQSDEMIELDNHVKLASGIEMHHKTDQENDNHRHLREKQQQKQSFAHTKTDDEDENTDFPASTFPKFFTTSFEEMTNHGFRQFLDTAVSAVESHENIVDEFGSSVDSSNIVHDEKSMKNNGNNIIMSMNDDVMNYDSIDIGVMHVSYQTGYDLLNILYAESSSSKSCGGPRVILDSKREFKIGNKQIILWMAISALLSACACTFLIVINNHFLWFSEEGNRNQNGQNQHQRQQRRRLAREQVQRMLPIYEYDGTTLHMVQSSTNNNHNINNDDGDVGDLLGSPSRTATTPLLSCQTDDSKNDICSMIKLDCCSICLDEYSIGDKVRCLPCNHAFHARCIGKWLSERSATCPLCKAEVEEDDEESSSSGSSLAEAAAEGSSDEDNQRSRLSSWFHPYSSYFVPSLESDPDAIAAAANHDIDTEQGQQAIAANDGDNNNNNSTAIQQPTEPEQYYVGRTDGIWRRWSSWFGRVNNRIRRPSLTEASEAGVALTSSALSEPLLLQVQLLLEETVPLNHDDNELVSQTATAQSQIELEDGSDILTPNTNTDV